MFAWNPSRRWCLSFLNSLLVVGGLTGVRLALGQESTPTHSVPALALSVEGQPTIPLEKLRSELELATGKRVTFGEQGSAGSLVVGFETDPAGAPRVTVVYHPPMAELMRNDTLPAGQLEGAHHIGLLAQGLIQRDAGITLLAPEPSPSVPDGALGSCAQSAELAIPVVQTRAPDSSVDAPAKPVEAPRSDESWRGALGLRLGPAGFGTLAGPFAEGAEGLERGAFVLDGAAWMVGATVHVDAPSSGLFKLGLEAFFDQFAIDGRRDDGVALNAEGTYIGLSAAPSMRLFAFSGFGELRLGVGVGITYVPFLNVTSGSDIDAVFNDGLGYRLGASVAGTAWVTDALGVTISLGFDHTFITGTGLAILPNANGTVNPTNVLDSSTDVWLNQPYLRVAAEYRF